MIDDKISVTVPDYESNCSNCGQSPVVTIEENGKVVHSTDMCGACTWGESDCIDPENW